MRLLFATLAVTAAVSGFAQAPVEDVRQRKDAILDGQQKAGAAYRELQQAGYASRQAEQDFRQADADYKSAQKRADELKRVADAAKKNLDAAKAREAKIRKSYDAALNSVDQNSRSPAPK